MTSPNMKILHVMQAYIRPRPFTKDETELKCPSIIKKITSNEITLKSGSIETKYKFEKIFNENASQTEVYNAVCEPLISYVVSGCNCTVLAYGQSGCGKTYTMIGEIKDDITVDFNDDSLVGLIPRASAQLFSELLKLPPKMEFTLRISFIEIYDEEVHDLIGDHSDLRIYEDFEDKNSVYMPKLTEVTVHNKKEVCDWLKVGISTRRGIRSHLVFTFSVVTKETRANGDEIMKIAKFQLVDLAGYENGKPEGTNTDVGNINKSILTFENVIKAVAQELEPVPYRDSKLTTLLRKSIGGNAKVSMIVPISPVAWEETIKTLEYAYLVRGIVSCVFTNTKTNEADLFRNIQKEMTKLKTKLNTATKDVGFGTGQEEHKEYLTQLIQQIRELEIYKTAKEQEYKELNLSFLRTKSYLQTAQGGLKPKAGTSAQ